MSLHEHARLRTKSHGPFRTCMNPRDIERQRISRFLIWNASTSPPRRFTFDLGWRCRHFQMLHDLALFVLMANVEIALRSCWGAEIRPAAALSRHISESAEGTRMMLNKSYGFTSKRLSPSARRIRPVSQGYWQSRPYYPATYTDSGTASGRQARPKSVPGARVNLTTALRLIQC